MDVGASQQRMAAFLRDNHDKVVGSWSELVAAGLRGRTSPQEVRRELEDLYSLIIRQLAGTDEHAAGARMMFDKMDTDHDGYLTKAELKAGHEKMMSKMHDKA